MGDLIEVFKIFKGHDNISSDSFFIKTQLKLKGRSLKIQKRVLHCQV